MTTPECVALSADLSTLVDGELRGTRMLRVLDHLDRCAECATRVVELRDLGEMLRAEAPPDPDPQLYAGLAGAVVCRAQAEAAASWGGLLRRAREDWRWTLVGVGAVAWAFALTTTVSALLAFGPRPERGDSLSALIANATRSTAGLGFVYATPVGPDQEWLIHVDQTGPMASRAGAEISPRSSRWSNEADVVDALLDAVTYEGHAVGFQGMAPGGQQRAEALLQEISRLRLRRPVLRAQVADYQIRLLASTSVSARGL